MENYQEQSRYIISKLESLIATTETVYPNAYKESIQDSIRRFQEERFKIVVVGEFSRGKSTFINALIGKEVFPSSRVPTTAIISELTYSEQPEYTLDFNDTNMSSQRITETEFKAIKAFPKTYTGDPEMESIYLNGKEKNDLIAKAGVGYPLSILKNNVEIIDTPGLNDAEEIREKITHEYMPQSDAVIFVLSAKKILAHTEIQLLERIISLDIHRIFFVINYSDVLKTEEDREKVLDYAKRKLTEKLSKEPSINMISSLIALKARRIENGEEVKGDIQPFEKSGFNELEEKLSLFLENERGKTKLEKPIAFGRRTVGEVIEKISIERSTLYQSADEIEQRIQKLKPELKKYRSSVDAITNTYKLKITNGKQELLSFLESGLRVISNSAIRVVQNYQGELDGESIQQMIELEILPLQSKLQVEVTTRQRAIITSAIQQAQDRYVKEVGELNQVLSTVLSTKQRAEGNKFTASTTEFYDTSFTTEIDDSMKNGIAAVGAGFIGLNVIGSIGLAGLLFAPLLIPVALLGIGGLLSSYFREGNRQKVMAKVRGQVEERYNMQIPSILQGFEEDWDAQAEMAARHFFIEANNRVDSIEAQLQDILQQKLSEQEKTQEREAVLNKSEQQLRQIETDLCFILKEKVVSHI